MEKRMIKGLVGGALLGIVCVIGANIRSGFNSDLNFIFALWYNRVIIGLVIGAPWSNLKRNKELFRGGILGLLVSFAFYASTNFQDPISFIAGIIYGVILEAYINKKRK
ncbi:MAG: hypothetical protein GX864_03795 [Mollicutes bacterium]|jgi:hypothetical protein|nr:hypothetical protein [Mollicutes bacterium]